MMSLPRGCSPPSIIEPEMPRHVHCRTSKYDENIHSLSVALICSAGGGRVDQARGHKRREQVDSRGGGGGSGGGEPGSAAPRVRGGNCCGGEYLSPIVFLVGLCRHFRASNSFSYRYAQRITLPHPVPPIFARLARVYCQQLEFFTWKQACDHLWCSLNPGAPCLLD